MKIFRLTYGLMAATALTLASCNINDLPKFSDSDAFVAFSKGTVGVGEEQGSVEIPVLLTSLSGLSANIEVEVVPDESGASAKEGEDFTIENKSLSFSGGEGATQSIKVNVIDNDIFTGNKSFTLRLKEGGSVKLGAAKTCKVTIQDNEHPLLFILGEYSCSMTSAFSGRGPWPDHVITIERDDSDPTKVWISNIDPYFAQYGYVAPDENYYYGLVNEEKTEIRIPCGQELGYDDVSLYGFTTPDLSGDVIDNGSIIIKIQDGGKKLVAENAFGVCMSSDLESGWYNAILGPVTFTKK